MAAAGAAYVAPSTLIKTPADLEKFKRSDTAKNLLRFVSAGEEKEREERRR